MPLKDVQVNNELITLAIDDARDAEHQFQVIVKARIIDTQTGNPVSSQIFVQTEFPGFTIRVGEGGFIGLCGVPAKVLALRGSLAYTIEFTIRAKGYVARDEVVVLPPNINLPVDLGDLSLMPAPLS